jgi:plasmid stabilization system protein ParE
LPIWRKLASLSQRIIHLLLRKWAPTSFGKRKNVAAFPRLGRIVPKFGNPQFREIISQSYRIIYKYDEEGDLVAILRIWHGRGFRLYGRAESCAFSSWCLGCIISLGVTGCRFRTSIRAGLSIKLSHASLPHKKQRRSKKTASDQT